MNKKELKNQYLLKQLEDPNISDFEKQEIKQRLGIETTYSEEDFNTKHGYELLSFVFTYFNDQLPVIRRKKRTSSPFDFLTNNQKTAYYLSGYDLILEQDSLEQLCDLDDFDEIKGLVEGFKTIGRFADAELVKSILNKKKISDKKITQLLDHFQEDEKITHEIEIEVEKFIRNNIKEILELQEI